MSQRTTIKTYGGLSLDLKSPSGAAIDIVDIAHHLSRVCRWNGATTTHWSVAAHSLVVEALVPPKVKLAALLGDAPEFCLGDVARPLKRMSALEGYRLLESRWQCEIEERFKAELDHEGDVWWADRIAAWAEAEVFCHGYADWTDRPTDANATSIKIAKAHIQIIRAQQEYHQDGRCLVDLDFAKNRFLARFHELTMTRPHEAQ